jgi:hypothetical protein
MKEGIKLYNKLPTKIGKLLINHFKGELRFFVLHHTSYSVDENTSYEWMHRDVVFVSTEKLFLQYVKFANKVWFELYRTMYIVRSSTLLKCPISV